MVTPPPPSPPPPFAKIREENLPRIPTNPRCQIFFESVFLLQLLDHSEILQEKLAAAWSSTL